MGVHPCLSVAMIVRNEEESIARVLNDAAAFADEIVVVDTGSVDATVKIAQESGARVEHFTWIDDFAAARNYAFEQCRGDWIMWLDADDTVPPDVQEGIRKLKIDLPNLDVDAVWLEYRYAFHSVAGRCIQSFPRERIIRRAAGLRWEGPVHEVIGIPAGRSLSRTDLHIDHRPSREKTESRGTRNLSILQRAYRGGDRSPRTLFYLGNELRDHERYHDALDKYRAYLKVSDCQWESYSALISMASCCRALDRLDEALGHATQAIALDPSRAEAFVAAGRVFYDRGRWDDAVPLFAAATAARRPDEGFVNDADYGWRAWDFLSVCHDRLGERRQALDAALRAIDGNPEKERVVKNLHWLVDQLAASE